MLLYKGARSNGSGGTGGRAEKDGWAPRKGRSVPVAARGKIEVDDEVSMGGTSAAAAVCTRVMGRVPRSDSE